MSTLVISDLVVSVAGQRILHRVDLEVKSGEVHAVMGPNGAGKSTLGGAILGHPAYEVERGSVTLDGVELLGLPTWERAAAGLYLAPQDSTEVPGVRLLDVLVEAARAAGRLEDTDPVRIAALLEEEGSVIGI